MNILKERPIRKPIAMVPPMVLCGFATDGKSAISEAIKVLGGAFQAADTNGIPLWFLLDQAALNNCIISMPHYFASAIEHGWDDKQTFDHMREGLVDAGQGKDFENIKMKCIAMFMDFAHKMPGKNAIEIAKAMREWLESDPLAHKVIDFDKREPITS